MFTVLDLVQPNSIEEAYQILIEKKNNTVLGGCAFLKMGAQRIGTAIELSKLNLNYIKQQNDYIEIGAMTTFRDIETNPTLISCFNGILPKAVSNVIGVQFRNVVTVGASVYSKYGFSDLIPALLALDTEVDLYKSGRMPLGEFLEKSYKRDILTRIFIKIDERNAAYQYLRNSASDFPVLTVAVSKLRDDWRIIVGGRPQRAKLARQASDEMATGNVRLENIAIVANMAATELSYGTNMRGTAEYRQAICKVLVARAITEVLLCK